MREDNSLSGKTVAVTGTTGGIGKELCRYLADCGANLILCDRNRERSESFKEELLGCFLFLKIECITVDLSDISSVKAATEVLKLKKPDILIHNAGAYSIPRKLCKTGLDNVFQINFASPYYITKELLPTLREKKGRVIAVGSIAHNYSKSDAEDIDFHTRKAASRVYGNAKRYLMFSLFELFKNESAVTLSIVHPGITFTNITAHYPKLVFAIIKHPMKLIFMRPKTAALSVLEGAFTTCGYKEWIGPRLFDIWGRPKKKKLNTCGDKESKLIFNAAEEAYERIKNGS